jgi:hypothetical protein
MKNMLIALAWGVLNLLAPAAHAATYHLDPVSGRLDHDGSAERPWPGLEQVIKAGLIRAFDAHGVPFQTNGVVRGGDRLELHAGYHGEAILNGYYLDRELTVAAAPGPAPQLRRIVLYGGARWRFTGLAISPSFAPVFVRAPMFVVYNSDRHGAARDITVEQCTLASTNDISSWTTTNQWLDNACDGISFYGEGCRAISNTVRHVSWGIQLAGVSNYAGYNVVEHFSGDGLRAVNHYAVAEYNVIRNAYQVNDNHMDGIQGFYHKKPGQEVRGVVIRGNTIIRHERLDAPLVSSYLQGIGFFDGPFTDCVFEDNVVRADSHHGLSVYNAIRCRISNNTVEEDAGTNLVQASRIVLGCKSSHGSEVRGNQIVSNRCDLLVIDPVAVDTVLDGNVIRRAR